MFLFLMSMRFFICYLLFDFWKWKWCVFYLLLGRMGSHEFEGNRTIPLWTTAPRTITSLLIAPRMICPGQLLHMPIAGRLPLVPIAPPPRQLTPVLIPSLVSCPLPFNCPPLDKSVKWIIKLLFKGFYLYLQRLF